MDKALVMSLVLFLSMTSGCFGLFDDELDTDTDDSECTEFEYSGGTASWTFMMYISDSDLEYFAITDIVEMEYIGSSEDVNIVVQFDRWDGYDAPDMDDESNGDWESAKRFYITRDCNGTLKDHEIHSPAVEDLGEINTGDPDELVSFVEWAMTNYPAENYALDIWDHGGGVAGVAYEQSCPDYCYSFGNEPDKLTLPEIDWALNEITNNGQDKLDIVGFDACLMSTIEVVEVVYPYADIMLASEILEPGTGWDYTFLEILIDEPETTASELGAEIVNSFVAQGGSGTLLNPSSSYALSMLDMSKAQAAIDSFKNLNLLVGATTITSDLDEVRSQAIHVEQGDSSSAVDLIQLLNNLAMFTDDPDVQNAAEEAASAVSDMIMMAESINGKSCVLSVCVLSDIDTNGMTGISVLFPSSESEWVTRSRGVSESVEESGWSEVMEDYYDYLEDEQVLFFMNESLIYDTADFDDDGTNDSISLALEIESIYDGMFGNLTLDVFNNRGYWIDGIEYEFEINSTEIVYLELWDVTYTHTEEDGPAEMLRIEAVLSLVLEDGTHILQEWVETPPEYLTHYHE
jgi:hypothetical protein